jgi:hypothetical protein
MTSRAVNGLASRPRAIPLASSAAPTAHTVRHRRVQPPRMRLQILPSTRLRLSDQVASSSLSVLPVVVFHASNPLADPPWITVAAALGLLNSVSRVNLR